MGHLREILPTLALLGLALLGLDCASGPVELHFVPIEGMVGEKVRLDSVVVDPSFYSRGCLAVDIQGGGENVSITIQQDGTSDWIVGRAAPGIARDAVVAALAFLNAPFDIVKGLLEIPPTQLPEPSEIHGCGGLFEE